MCTSLIRRLSLPMYILIMVLVSTLIFLQNADRPTEIGITFPDPVKNPSAFTITMNITIFYEQYNSNIFLNPYNLWDLAPAALISLNHTNDTRSISNQYPQPSTRQPRTDSYSVFSSLRTMDSKRKGLRVSSAFFQRNYLSNGRVNETVATNEELSDLRRPGAMDGIPPFVKNCTCVYVWSFASLV